MKIIINGIFVTSKIIQTKKGKDLQINTILDSSGGNVVLVGDTVRVDTNKTPIMLPVTIEAEVEVSNYNGLSLLLKSFSSTLTKI